MHCIDERFDNDERQEMSEEEHARLLELANTPEVIAEQPDLPEMDPDLPF